ncbi:alkaline phosphatase D family protein [Ramlibacter sp. PS4R-6]|uniref:alkaline phosphatase D family protein n=1 Tax=Ramlibacter sp. PS4R-6 TaxID=3133438 RepID=UPI0030969767
MLLRRRQFVAWGASALAGCAAAPARLAGHTVIGFASCTEQSHPQPMWDTILAQRPDFFVFAGDNVYADRPPFSLAVLRDAYAMQEAVPGFARLRATVPHMAIWDDGDYGENDGGADFAFKQPSKDEFLKFWRAPADDPRRAREGLYDARMVAGRVQVIVLDTRWFRSPLKRTDERNAPGKERYVPDADPAKTMLGPQQWAWLEEQLRQPADLRLIVSSVQVVADGHGWERWGNLPLERQKLYDLVKRTRANGIVFLSGDRHIGAIYRETDGTPYPLHDITSSGVTHSFESNNEAGPNRVGPPFTGLNFGTVDVDWAARTVELAVRDIRGAKRRAQSIHLDELKAPT